MINYLKGCQKSTLIGQLPDIINSNNQSIENEFNWIFDSSLNRLTKSVYAPTGSVKTHFGEFVNLACEYLTIKNIDSLQNSIQKATENIINETLNVSSMQIVLAALTNIANSSFIDPAQYNVSTLCDISTLVVNHNVLNNRFHNLELENSNYAHDAESILYQKNDNEYISVSNELNTINSNINEISNKLSIHITLEVSEGQHLYLCVPLNTDISNYNLKYIKYSKIANRSFIDGEPHTIVYRYHNLRSSRNTEGGLGRDLVELKISNTIAKSDINYDYYEIFGAVLYVHSDNTLEKQYVNIGTFINTKPIKEQNNYYLPTSLEGTKLYEGISEIPIGYLLNQKKGGLCLCDETGKFISNIAGFKTEFVNQQESLYNFTMALYNKIF